MIVVYIKYGKNSVEWRQDLRRMEKLLQWGLGVMSCIIYSEAVLYSGRFISWLLILLCSTSFPAFVLTMIESVNGVNLSRPTDILTAGRALPIVLFGLRYGMIMNQMGVLGCLDAVLFQSTLLKHQRERCASVFVKDYYFYIPTRILVGYASFRVLVSAGMGSVGMSIYPFASLAACMQLLILNYLVNNLIVLGTTVANCAFEQGMENVLPNQAGVRKPINVLGSMSFATWLLLLCGILLSY